jgi:DNA-directed RNA polymerase subunit RPC12/RpoP
MSMVCPKCSGSFEKSVNCPSCGVRLLYESKLFTHQAAKAAPRNHWLEHPLGRIAAGIFLAQGLAYSFQLMCNAYIQAATTESQSSVWSTLYGLVLLQSIQGVSLLAGGALAGAAQRRPDLRGAMVGAVHSSIFLVVLRLRGEQLNEIALYGQPVLHIAFGVLGAVIGARIWQPLPDLVMPESEDEQKRRSASKYGWLTDALQGPVAWGRVSAGIVIVTAGFLWGPSLLHLVLDASQGTLKISDRLQAQLVTWEIMGLTALLGAAGAGATTRNGLKQGLFVGAGACTLLIGNYVGAKNLSLELIAYTACSILGLTIAGGWFGGQLFPPVVQWSRRRLARY